MRTCCEMILVVSCFLSCQAIGGQADEGKAPGTPSTIGIVFTGGGSFGAFEAGALQGVFSRWMDEHGVVPPVKVIAGASTGALISPFVALGPEGVKEIADLYQTSVRRNIFRLKPSVFLPFILFSKWSSSVYSSDPLSKLLLEKLSDERLRLITGLWPRTRVVVLGTEFGSGTPALYSNAPGVSQDPARIRDAILASASSPLASSPIYMKSNITQTVQPHFDGGISEVAPFQVLFDIAAQSPEIILTQIFVISPYPLYPGSNSGAVQQKQFPTKPNFGEIGARTGALIAESSISKEIALAWAAISLRNAGVSVEKVRERTGLNIERPPGELILIAPDTRLGWDSSRFNRKEMQEMFMRGRAATPRALIP